MPSFPRAAAAGTAFACAAVLLGCSSERDQQARDMAAKNKSNIQRLANVYAAFQNGKGGKGPKDEADFKAFIKDYDPFKVQSMGFDPGNIDKAFTSERDGAAFKIRYNVGGGKGSVDAVVFESAGKDGKKQVGFTGGRVDEVDDATYQTLWAGKKAAGSEGPAGVVGAPDPKAAGRPSGAPVGAPKGPPGK